MERSEKIILAVMVLLLAGVMAAVLLLRNQQPPAPEPEPAAQEFVAPAFETEAVSGTPTLDEEALFYRMLDISDEFRVGVCGRLSANAEGSVDVYYTSAETNAVWTRLQILTETGEQLGATGVLHPGEYVRALHLDTLPEENCSVVLRFLSYEPETYYSRGTATATVSLTVPEHP